MFNIEGQMNPDRFFSGFFRRAVFILCLFSGSGSSFAGEATVPKKEAVVLLTGAAGFIGSNFLKYTFDKYDSYQFLVLDALTYAGNLDNIPNYIKDSERFHFFQGSVTNLELVDSLMKQADFVVHFAAESHVSRSIQDDAVFFETDVIGTRVMMQALHKNKNVKRFIHISTSEVFGTAEQNPMTEEHPLNPRSPYAAAKAGADRLVYAYWCTFDLPTVLVRPFNNYGHNQHPEKVIPRFITNILKGEPLTIHGDGSQMRDWVHTHDTSRALDAILHVEDFSKIKNQIINIGSGKPISVLEIANKIINYFELDKTALRFVEDRPGQVDLHVSSTEKSSELLGWTPEISFDEGLKDVIEWYKNNETWWKKREDMRLIPITTKQGEVVLQ
jgi:dTDP-glucose 4,6-dehydratase